jgi:uncharacterized membrane protein
MLLLPILDMICPVLMISVIVIAVAYIVAKYIQKRKNKTFYSWFILGCLLAAVFALILFIYRYF